MRKIALIILMIGVFFTLISLSLFGYTEKPKPGYIMPDGRKNPFPKGSVEAARWSQKNPIKELEPDPEPEPEPQMKNDGSEKDLDSKD